MDVNTKVKELEDELKVLKTEIRNVLLDVREVILDRANPLSEGEPAYLRVDLKTTAQAIAAEEAARMAAESAEEAARAAAKAAEKKKEEEKPKEELEQPEEPEESDILAPPPEDEAAEQATDEEQTEDELEQPEEPEEVAEPEPPPEEETPRRRKRRPEASPELADISAAYRFYPPLAVGTGSLAAWVADAMAAIGPQQLDRVITIHRLWGCLPPNISQALAHLQELIRCSQEVDPPWLKIMQDMERLSSS
jgi:chemotaxis protein histidine kinase CheA